MNASSSTINYYHTKYQFWNVFLIEKGPKVIKCKINMNETFLFPLIPIEHLKMKGCELKKETDFTMNFLEYATNNLTD